MCDIEPSRDRKGVPMALRAADSDEDAAQPGDVRLFFPASSTERTEPRPQTPLPCGRGSAGSIATLGFPRVGLPRAIDNVKRLP